jgi:transcriptional regulator with GAF, ATPase, and Fis domain
MTSAAPTEPVSRFWTKIGMVADIARILRGQPSGKSTMCEVLKLIARIIPLDAAALYILDKKKDKVEKVAAHGNSVDLCEFLRFKQGDGLSGWVARQKRPVVIQGRDPQHDGVRNYHDSVMVLPLTVMNDLIGLLYCSSHERRAFDTNRQRLMEIIADQVAISLERIMYQQELESKNEALLKAQKELKEAQEHVVAQENLKAVGDLAASVNHEVNNPLSVIIGNAQIIELEAADFPEKLTNRIKAIVDGAKRISLITHKLLRIDRLVTESYLSDQKRTILNIHKSAGGSA